MQVFEIQSQTAYQITLEKVDIEDVGDEFLTEEELDEMGISAWGRRSGTRLHPAAITQAIEYWVGQIPEGKKSIKCTDADLIRILSEGHHVSDFIGEGEVRRVGDRFYKHEPKSKPLTVRPSDLGKFINLVEAHFRKFHRYGFLSLDASMGEKHKAFPLLKKIITWDEVVESNNEQAMLTPEMLDLIKPLWDDPEIGTTMFPEKK